MTAFLLAGLGMLGVLWLEAAMIGDRPWWLGWQQDSHEADDHTS